MISRSLSILCLLLLLMSCRDEFVLEGEFQDIPVAYGYLDASDERHFIRVEKAFLEQGGNAELNAGNADLIYYGDNEAAVVLQNITTGEEQELERVDAREFFRNRAEGIFSNNPNVAYTFTDDDMSLTGGDEVRLLIERPGEETAEATTTLLREIDIIRPNDLVRVAEPNRPLTMNWTRGPEASIYDVRVYFNIRELFPNNASMNRTVRLEWELTNAYVPSEGEASETNVRYIVDPIGFYQFLGNTLEPDPNVVRRFESFDVQVAAAGTEVLQLRSLQNANSGLTSSGSLPRYTNLEGGIGLVTSNTVSLKEGIGFDGESLDSLRFGQFTRDLGFQ